MIDRLADVLLKLWLIVTILSVGFVLGKVLMGVLLPAPSDTVTFQAMPFYDMDNSLDFRPVTHLDVTADGQRFSLNTKTPVDVGRWLYEHRARHVRITLEVLP